MKTLLMAVALLAVERTAAAQEGKQWDIVALRARLFEDWRKLVELDDASKGYDFDMSFTGEPISNATGKVRKQGPFRLVEYTHKDGGSVIGINSKYSFFLKREGSSDQAWTIGVMSQDLQSRDSQGLKSYFHGHRTCPLSIVLFDEQPDLQKEPRDLENDPNFRIISAREERGGLVRVHFAFPPRLDEAEECFFVVDLNHYSLVVASQTYTKTGRISFVSERTLIADSPPDRLRVQYLKYTRTLPGKEPSATVITYRYPEALQRDDIPESTISLSAYDLPEPVGVVWPKEPSRSRWWWLAGAAAAALFLAAAFRYLHRRRARRNPTVAIGPTSAGGPVPPLSG